MEDRDFWLTVRRALIMIVSAIEKRYNIQAKEAVQRLEVKP